MAIELHSETSITTLVDALADDLAAHWPTDPFAPLPIVVANRAVERWLRHELATRLHVLANVAYPLLRPALDAAVAWSLAPAGPADGRWWVAPTPPAAGAGWDAHTLRGKILAAVRLHRLDPDFTPVARYLYGEGAAPSAASHREVALSGEVAAVIERLMRERHEDALAWARDAAVASGAGPAWLRRLCAELGLAADGSPARQRERLLATPGRELKGPPLRIFGATALAPADRRVLVALSGSLDVRWYRPTPVHAGSDPFANPVLAGLGRAEQTERRALTAAGLTAPPVPAPAVPAPTTFLTRLQAWIHADASVAPDAPWPRDKSLTFHRTYGPQRQVEVLRDLLLAAFAADGDLEPRDVLVLTPDLETYAPSSPQPSPKHWSVNMSLSAGLRGEVVSRRTPPKTRSGAMARWTMEARELTNALQQMRRVARGTPGDAGWCFATDGLRIEWAGLSIGVPAAGDSSATIRVRGPQMKGVLRLPLPKAGDHIVRVEDGRLYLDGSCSIPCVVVPDAVPQLLPTDCRPVHVALLPYRHSRDEIAAAGLREQLAEVSARRDRSTSAAASALQWLGVTESQVGAWVDEHLASLANGTPKGGDGVRTVVVDRAGQIDLFTRG